MRSTAVRITWLLILSWPLLAVGDQEDARLRGRAVKPNKPHRKPHFSSEISRPSSPNSIVKSNTIGTKKVHKPETRRLETDRSRWIVKCHTDVDLTACGKHILDVCGVHDPKTEEEDDDDAQVRVLFDVDIAHSVAISVQKKHGNSLRKLLEAFFEEVSDDGRLKPMMLRKKRLPAGRRLQNIQSNKHNLDMIRVPQFWEAYGDMIVANVTVCFIDSGIDADHPELEPSLLSGSPSWYPNRPWSEDVYGHGTHMAGIVAAQEGGLLRGVMPNVKVHAVRAMNDFGDLFESDLLMGMQKCKEAGADVVSMSLGGWEAFHADAFAAKTLFEDHGMALVASSGNAGVPRYEYPASYPHVLSVAAVDAFGNTPVFSTFNDQVDVSAPGVNVIVLDSDGAYASATGTSVSVPFVAGVLALLKSVVPMATPEQLYRAVRKTAYGNDGVRTDRKGYGILDAKAAADYLVAELGVDVEESSTKTAVESSTTPSLSPTDIAPSSAPSKERSAVPTKDLSAVPTKKPSAVPTKGPSVVPVMEPSVFPTKVPSAVPFMDPTAAPLEISPFPSLEPPKEVGCPKFSFKLLTDAYGYETTYFLMDLFSGEMIFHAHELKDASWYVHETCLSADRCYLFYIHDTYGDGISEPGEIYLNISGERVVSDGSIGHGGEVVFGLACDGRR